MNNVDNNNDMQIKNLRDLFKISFYKQEQIRNCFLMAITASITLVGYEFARSSTNVLFKNVYSTQDLPFVLALTPVVLLPLLYIYNLLLKKFGPHKTLFISTILSSLLFIILYQLMQLKWRWPVAVLYVFREGYIVLLIEQYWSFINSSLQSSEAKKVNGIIMAVAGLGGVVGGFAVHQLSRPLGTAYLILMCAFITLFSFIPAHFAYKNTSVKVLKKEALPPKKDSLGLSFLWQEKILFGIMLIVIFSQFYSVVIYLNFENEMQIAYPNPDQQTSFSGLFYAYVNIIALIFQLILAPILLSKIRPTIIFLMIPLLHLAALIFIFIHPSVAAAGTAFLIFKSTEYSIFRSTKEIFYIPFPDDVRFRTKEFIDIFCHRVSKSTISIIIAGCKQAGIIISQSFYLIIIFVSLIAWFASCMALNKNEKNH
ncbi:MAG: MFS transporter [Oligoflexia bacterium]|nr:MFS transporter [Oligoflexia bacterium]